MMFTQQQNRLTMHVSEHKWLMTVYVQVGKEINIISKCFTFSSQLSIIKGLIIQLSCFDPLGEIWYNIAERTLAKLDKPWLFSVISFVPLGESLNHSEVQFPHWPKKLSLHCVVVKGQQDNAG